jgi:hypothetical protein
MAPRQARILPHASSLLCTLQVDTATTSLFTGDYNNQSSYTMGGQHVYCGTPILEYKWMQIEDGRIRQMTFLTRWQKKIS